MRNPVFRRNKYYIYVQQLEGGPAKQTKTHFSKAQEEQAKELQAKLNAQVAAQRALLQEENLKLDNKTLTAATWLRIWGRRRRAGAVVTTKGSSREIKTRRESFSTRFRICRPICC